MEHEILEMVDQVKIVERGVEELLKRAVVVVGA